MYLARVLVGQYCQGNSSMIVPPPKNPSRPEILYESVVDNQGNPSVFVVFYDTQCYPDYLITFWSVCFTWATGYFSLTLEISMQCFEKSKVVKRNSVFLTLTKCRYQVRYVTKLSVVAVDILKNWSKERVHSCLGCVYSRVMNSVVGVLGHTKEAFVSCLRQNLGDLLWSDYKQPFRLGYLLHRISLRRLICPGLNQTSRSWREELYSCFLIKSNKFIHCFYCCVICLRLKRML